MLKKSLVSVTMLGMVVIALASSGGGKKKAAAASPSFVPVRATGSFALKARPDYTGSHVLGSVNLNNAVVYKALITYQKGNTTYILPTQHRLSSTSKLSFKSSQSPRSNLKMVDLKIRLCR